MALFKPYKGLSADLANVTRHEGYMYFTTDDGKLHADVQVVTGTDEGTGEPITELRRVTINAGNINANGRILGPDDLYSKIEIDTKFDGLSATIGYIVTIPEYDASDANWSGGAGAWTYTFAATATEPVACGKDDSVPPILSRTDATDEMDYSKLLYAKVDVDADPRTIQFTFEELPAAALPIQVVVFS